MKSTTTAALDPRLRDQLAKRAAAHQDRYADITVEGMESLQDLRLAAQHDARGRDLFSRGLRILAEMRALYRSDHARHRLGVAMDLMGEAAAADHCERLLVQRALPRRQEVIVQTGRAGMQACEAERP